MRASSDTRTGGDKGATPDTNGWSLTIQNGWPVELRTVTSAHADASSVAIGAEGGDGPVLTNVSAVALSADDKDVSIQVRVDACEAG